MRCTRLRREGHLVKILSLSSPSESIRHILRDRPDLRDEFAFFHPVRDVRTPSARATIIHTVEDRSEIEGERAPKQGTTSQALHAATLPGLIPTSPTSRTTCPGSRVTLIKPVFGYFPTKARQVVLYTECR